MCGNRTGTKLGLIFKTGTGIRSYLFEELDPQLDSWFHLCAEGYSFSSVEGHNGQILQELVT
jgi:hypothetical protein